MKRLEGKVCLITGGSRGQGAAEARLFRSQGATVWIGDVLDAEGEALAAEIGAHYRHLDVTDEQAWEQLIETIVAQSGQLNVLVNNAGIFRTGRMVDTSKASFEQVMDVNCTGVFLGMKIATPALVASGNASIVNISSLAGLRGAAFSMAYGASKWAVRGMTKAAAIELGRKGVRVNSIHPGLIETPMAEQIGPGIERMIKRTPIGRVAQAEEVANMALFLASDESSYSTGSEFVIDGGLSSL